MRVLRNAGIMASTTIAMFLLSACGQKISSDPNVVNGKVIDSTEYPEVVMIYSTAEVDGEQKAGMCTATFISDSTVLTAAHCTMLGEVVDPRTGKVDLSIDIIRVQKDEEGKIINKEVLATSVAAYRNPDWDAEFKKQQVNNYDLGVVVFPEGTSQHIANIRTSKPQIGEELTVVGFGLNYVPSSQEDVDSSSAFIKRMGHNKVSKPWLGSFDGFIYFEGATETTTADGSNANASSGDSGGPLFIDGKLAGVTSGGGRSLWGTGVSLYIDLQSEISKKFLNKIDINY